MRITHCARIAAYTMLGKKRHTLRVFINMLLISCAPIPDLIDKKEYDKIERKRRVRNERTKT